MEARMNAVTVGVVGAGATGAYLAARLAEAGLSVTLVARGRSLERIRNSGIEIADPDGTRRLVRPARVIAPEEPSPPADFVLFCVKSYDTEEASDVAARLAGSEGRVVCLQNGVRNEQILADRLEPGRVLSAVLYVGAQRTAPGIVVCSAPARVIVGPYDASGDVDAAEEVHRFFSKAGIECTVQNDVSTAKWLKFLFNCGLNPLTAVTGQTLGRLLAEPSTAAAFDTLVNEAIEVAEASGAPLPGDARARVAETARRLDISSSMAEDLAAGRAIELDAFTGYVLQLGEMHGIVTPATSVMHGILTALDAGRQPAAER